MPILQTRVDLFAVTNNTKRIAAAANTINLSFSRDPLIQWLRPDGLAWEHLHQQIRKWQYRRIQQALCQGIVLQSACVRDIMEKLKFSKNSLPQLKSPINVATSNVVNSIAAEVSEEPGSSDSAAVIILFPPKGHMKWSFSRFLLVCKMWLLNWIDPAIDKEADHLRLEKLLAAHDSGMESIRRRYECSEVWYLEVIAIHPLLQSCGLGKRVMQQVLEYTKGQVVALECTSERNIPFYEKLGFRIEEEVELTGIRKPASDGLDTVKYWLMVKNAENR